MKNFRNICNLKKFSSSDLIRNSKSYWGSKITRAKLINMPFTDRWTQKSAKKIQNFNFFSENVYLERSGGQGTNFRQQIEPTVDRSKNHFVNVLYDSSERMYIYNMQENANF